MKINNYWHFLKIGSLFGMLGFVGACEVINPEEPIPAYLYVTDVQFVAEPFSEGSDSEKITEVWLSVSGDFLGAYAVPALIPLLEFGEQTITISAGIKDNGISNTPEIYPFYKGFTFDRNLQPNVIDTIRPIFRYSDQAKFAFIEDFEGSTSVFQVVRIGDQDQFSISNEDPFEGNASGLITLDSVNTIFEIATEIRYDQLKEVGTAIYLELNYKSDVPVVFGLVGYNEGDFPSEGIILLDPGFFPSEDWNKIYFNLTENIFELNKDEYQIALQAFIPFENGQPSVKTAKVYLDNVKLLHF
ncbi:MAG TPA: hypothetical protein PKA00_03695 [Saprospiraceae bacterium]|nr:hypothetical protein [Saprospiraceae bacterium]HMQ81980.1 hypothetical protein [Saprospiraceae bacterium]